MLRYALPSLTPPSCDQALRRDLASASSEVDRLSLRLAVAEEQVRRLLGTTADLCLHVHTLCVDEARRFDSSRSGRHAKQSIFGDDAGESVRESGGGRETLRVSDGGLSSSGLGGGAVRGTLFEEDDDAAARLARVREGGAAVLDLVKQAKAKHGVVPQPAPAVAQTQMQMQRTQQRAAPEDDVEALAARVGKWLRTIKARGDDEEDGDGV